MFNAINRINELMRIKGWTPYELSNQTGITTNAIYDWNKIGAVPSLPNIIKICEAMGITLEYFFCGGNYQQTDEESRILNKWVALSDFEKNAVMKLIESFNALKG
ncbi:MAG: helix-turn-helix transcriptional regulator [Clostridiales bacterium]|nr:helix-turn-helix transcriptional regulator [Clostridiales bacterium]